MTDLDFRFATVKGRQVNWFLRRNCSATPKQLLGLYVSLCTVSFGIGLFFWFQGAALVAPFAALELLVVGCAFLAYSRHAADRECLSLSDGRLLVELECAGKLERMEFFREWVRVESHTGDGSLIELSAGGKMIRVGRFIRPELRPLLAKEIRLALLTA